MKWILLGSLGAVVLGLGVTYFLWPQARPELRAETHLRCWQVGECADDCSQRCPNDLKKFSCMLDCKARCERRACPGADALHDRLASCAQKRCLMRCIGGPGPECKRCTLSSCKEYSEACEAHRCPDG